MAQVTSRQNCLRPVVVVTPARNTRWMDVIGKARERGFELEERVIGDGWVHGWSRGDYDRWRCFHEHRLALSWMDDG